ncbi:hypothetical protein GCM10011611_23200 [Aliidongia dinghuensis]|uniref:OmpR/PhoB-type domain-containing protein n=1 Tax=Aliidongia dinghuensis TaxID=1867774 RepID=A0A8J2YST0_9PROT|nr:winged helix-turn-helix domain-containing protein [Aliidongia dinghuensis]GGF16801.1 hypothetical protein GCM10011611_23200 [Aliidongia dinghuensis]
MPDVERVFRFGPFCLRPDRRILTCREEAVAIGGRPFDLLVALVERRDRVVAKDELKAVVWPEAAIVEDHTLVVTLASVRKALGAAGGTAKFVGTVTGRGYRFLAPVAIEHGAADAASVNEVLAEEGPAQRLPVPPDRLVGREADLATLLARLPEARLVTLWGAGGIGKTRLAVALAAEAARHYPDGVWFVELAPLRDPRLVVETIAAMLGLPIQGPRPALETVTTFLRPKRLLLVLDSCEHLIDESARFAEAIARHCPEVAILATSRERLSIAGEWVYRVPPLTTPALGQAATAADALRFGAVRLFAERADAALGGFALDDDSVGAVGEICRRLDGLALAIELAAAGLELLTPAALLAHLDARLGLLGAGGRKAPSRHQTLRSTIDWSYDLLTEPERALLRRLSVFAGSFTVASARAVALDDAGDMPDAIAPMLALVDKSLVAPVPAVGDRRFRLLESMQAYGAEKLAPAERRQCLRSLALYLVRFYEEGERLWPTTPTEAWLGAYEPELENLRAALDWAFGPDGDAALGQRLVGHAQELWAELSLLAERQRWLARAEAQADGSTPPAVLGRLRLAAGRNAHPGDPRFLEATLEALEIFRRIDDRLHVAAATDQAGRLMMKPGDTAKAEPYLRDGLVLLRGFGPTKLLTSALYSAVSMCWYADDMAGVRRHLDEIDRIAPGVGDTRMLQAATMMLAELDFAAGRRHEAIARARAAAAAWHGAGHANGLANIQRNLAGYLVAIGDAAGGRAAARAALALTPALGKSLSTAFAIQHLALAEAIDGRAVRAARLAGYSDGYFRAQRRTRESIEQALWDDLSARLEAALPPARLADLLAEGAAWNEEQVVTVALGTVALESAVGVGVGEDRLRQHG